MDLALLGAWAWLALTMAAYFVYLLSGLTQTLWARAAGSRKTTCSTSA